MNIVNIINNSVFFIHSKQANSSFFIFHHIHRCFNTFGILLQSCCFIIWK
jgi:hypothetical protein